MLSIKGLAVAAIMACVSMTSRAQPNRQTVKTHEDLPRAEGIVGYSYARANATPGQCGCFNLNGGEAEVAVRAYRNVSLVFDLTGEHAGTTSVANQSLSLLTYTAGPRFSYPVRTDNHVRWTPFVQALVGAAHGFDAPFPKGGVVTGSATAFAMFLGGGVDYTVDRSFAVRIVQADYGLTHLPNSTTNSQNLFRLSTGVVYRFK